MSPDRIEYGTQRARAARASHFPSAASLAVIGLGGLPFAVSAASRGILVRAYEPDEIRALQLESREASFLNPEEEVLFKKARTLRVTAAPRDIAGLGAYVVSVPTPVDRDGVADLTGLKDACATVGAAMRVNALVVIESAVNPGVCEELLLPIIEKRSGLSRHQFLFASCPARPTDVRWRVGNTPRVMGGLNKKSLENALALYRTVIDADVVPMRSTREAEAVSMLERTFFDVNTAFVNEMAVAFERIGIDSVNVIKGASTKPFDFLPFYPGAGRARGSMPVDPYLVLRGGQQSAIEARLTSDALKINGSMPFYAVRLLTEALRDRRKSMKHATVALLGLARAGDGSDMRDSPALVMRDALEKKGARVRAFDPYIPHASTARSLHEALRSADAALIATDHAEFSALTPAVFEQNGVPVVVDAHNCLDNDAFLDSPVRYRGIGR